MMDHILSRNQASDQESSNEGENNENNVAMAVRIFSFGYVLILLHPCSDAEKYLRDSSIPLICNPQVTKTSIPFGICSTHSLRKAAPNHTEKARSKCESVPRQLRDSGRNFIIREGCFQMLLAIANPHKNLRI